MRIVLNADEMRHAEKPVLDALGEDRLIETAADGIFSETDSGFARYVILAGTGNNGSDALSVALRLIAAGRKTDVYVCGNPGNEYNKTRREKLMEKGIVLRDISLIPEAGLNQSDCVIDGLFGIGLSRELDEDFDRVINAVNHSGAFILSIDIPSGLNSLTGTGRLCVHADKTVTLGYAKPGHYLGNGKEVCGELVVKDIGVSAANFSASILDDGDILFPERKVCSNKGNYPKVKIIAGSGEMIGASLMAHESCLAALRSGAGYATLMVPESLKSVYQMRVKEEMLSFIPDSGGKIIFDSASLLNAMNSTALVFGPGLGKNDELIKIADYLLKNYTGTLIIDADGLNCLAGKTETLRGHKCRLVLTPHIREFERLTGKWASPDNAVAFAREYDCIMVLKNACTFITDGHSAYINDTGSPAMAKAGSGDVLSGMIAAYSGYFDILKACAAACHNFGRAGERAAERAGEHSVLASDLIGIIKENNG